MTFRICLARVGDRLSHNFASALIVMSLNEQPVMLLFAAPALVLIWRPDGLRDSVSVIDKPRLSRRLLYSAWLAGSIGTAVVLYLFVHRLTCGVIESGNGSAVPWERLPERLLKLKEELVSRLILEETAKGALMRCRDAAMEHTRTAGLLGLLLFASAIPWCKVLWTRRREPTRAATVGSCCS